MKIEDYQRHSMRKLELSESHKMRSKSSGFGLNLAQLSSVGSLSESAALKVDTFYACVKDKSETIGQLPVKLYRKLANGSREQVKKGKMWRLLTQNPNDYMTTQEFAEMMSASLETNGVFYAYKERNDLGNLMSIIPFRFQSNVVPQMDQNGNVYYVYTRNDGQRGDPYRVEDLVVIKNFTIDGFTPVRPLTYMSSLLGIAKTQEESYEELQTNGITSQMALSTDSIFSDPNAIARLKDDWSDFRGVRGRSKIPVLENGLKPVNLNLTPAETDLFNQREFTNKRIANMVGVPMYRIDPNGTISKGVIPELDEAYLRNKLNPILRKYEKAMSDALADDLYIEVDRKAYYAGSPWRLVEHVEKEVKGGLAMINEGREDLGREPIEGGDVFAIDNNNVTYGKWTELEKLQSQIYNGGTSNSNNDNEEPTDEE